MGRTLLLILALSAVSSVALAHGGGHKNLEVLDDVEHKVLDRGMKSLAKGLGVKCSACHVKGELASDDVPAKRAARKFLAAVIGQSDPARKKRALNALLSALKKDAAKDEALIWKAVSTFKRKPAAS